MLVAAITKADERTSEQLKTLETTIQRAVVNALGGPRKGSK